MYLSQWAPSPAAIKVRVRVQFGFTYARSSALFFSFVRQSPFAPKYKRPQSLTQVLTGFALRLIGPQEPGQCVTAVRTASLDNQIGQQRTSLVGGKSTVSISFDVFLTVMVYASCMVKKRRYLAYLLRPWKTSDGEKTPWRASLQSSDNAERYGFASLEELRDFVQAQTKEGDEGNNC